jgi:hypothetical protein
MWVQGSADNADLFMYATLSDGSGASTSLLNDSADLSSGDWQEWNIDLRDFADVDAADADTLAIGLAGLDGSSMDDSVRVDDVRVYAGRCMPDVIQPVADLNNDCVVDVADIELMIDAWGMTSEAEISDDWVNVDVGNTTPGSAVIEDGTFTITADGADIWGNADQFHYVYKELRGDAEISARVVEIGEGTSTWAKAGVMIRDTLDDTSKHMMMVMTSQDGGGIAFQGRATTGGGSTSFHDEIQASPPHWVKLTKVGSTITAYHSDNGEDWDLFTDASPDGAHSNPFDVPMGGTVHIGLAVTSHQDGELRTAVMDNVTLTGLLTDLPADLNGDGEVGWPDLFLLLDEWMLETPWPY